MRFAVPVLAVFTACTPGVDAQLDELADDVAALSEENEALSEELDELAAENAALSAQLDALNEAGDVTTLAAPVVKVAVEYTFGSSYTWMLRAEGEGVTHMEAAVYQYDDPIALLGETSGDDCAVLTLPDTAYGGVTVWVWQDNVITCHSTLDDRCAPLWGVSSLDEC